MIHERAVRISAGTVNPANFELSTNPRSGEVQRKAGRERVSILSPWAAVRRSVREVRGY